ncbi:unnamed protein product [Psylliodes chrysocephalus]|uniref:Uncharacterized protein n=1 Tax=Psylliodes chrysocephalus TaxID=3402493 RepID=A0A9P0CLK5_9CUCU|nr:unnamed protein product [Psylliodes chrysocephala]
MTITSIFIFLLTIWFNIRASNPTPTGSFDWDYLIFSQRWPITSCAQWKEANAKNTCDLPVDKRQWIVHGIWPTKQGTEGPFFCPSAIHFDPNQLNPFLDQLNAHWTNVEANTKEYSFWKHEWDKHGTCATILPQLNSIPNFFKKGLEWNKVQNLADILTQSKIIPGQNRYNVEQIANAVKAVTKHNPMIECVIDSHTKESMISEIRICFDKSLEVIDCDQSHPINNNSTNVITNCSSKKAVMYLDTIPSDGISYQMDYIDNLLQSAEDHHSLLETYKFLKFLIWFSV